jgi:hypothetical protein
VGVSEAELHSHGARAPAEGVRIHTAAIGPFPAPINLAQPSPDGRWVAGAGMAPRGFCPQAVLLSFVGTSIKVK